MSVRSLWDGRADPSVNDSQALRLAEEDDHADVVQILADHMQTHTEASRHSLYATSYVGYYAYVVTSP